MTNMPLPKGSKDTRKFRKLTLKETFGVMKLLEQHCKTVDGHAVYDEGWNDEAVANQALPDFPGQKASAVSHIRNTEYGPVPRAKPQASGSPSAARLDRLERAIKMMADKLGVEPEEIGL